MLSVGAHVGLPWLAIRLVAPPAAPWQQDIQLLNVAPAFAPSGDAVIKLAAVEPRELVPPPPPVSSAPREHRPGARARSVAHLIAPPAPSPARATSSMVAPRTTAPLHAQAGGAHQDATQQRSLVPPVGGEPSPSSSRSGARARVGKAAAPTLAGYLRSARERVLRHRKYPHVARRAKLEGTVCLRVSITASGDVRRVRVTCGSSHELLVGAALQSVKEAAPFSALPNELGQELTIDMPVVFELAR